MTATERPLADSGIAAADRHPVGWLGIALVVVALYSAVGPVGALLGVAIAGVWFLTGVPYAIGAATVGYVVATSGFEAATVGFVGVAPELGSTMLLLGGMVLGLLVAATVIVRDAGGVWRPIVVLVASAVVLSGLGIRAIRWTDSFLVGVLAVAVAIGIGVYGLHRVSVVDLQDAEGVGIVSEAFGIGPDWGRAGPSSGDGDSIEVRR